MESAAAEGLEQLGEGIVYSSVMALPAPTAQGSGIMHEPPVMHELPRRVDGLHPTEAALQAMQEGRFHSTHYHGYGEYVLPEMVPARLIPELKAASTLCRIKRGISSWIKRVKNGTKKDKA